MRHLSILTTLSLVAAPALAQLPAPTLTARVAPRAAWSAVTSAGVNTTGTTFRAGNPGAASSTHLYVFGGSLNNNTATTLNDLYAFDAVAGTFTQLIANSVAGSPTHRGVASVAWNPSTNKLVVFGGNTKGGATGAGTATLLNDTWEWDPTAPIATSWTDVTPVSGSPTPRLGATMAYDPATGGMLLFGGQTSLVAPATCSDETWLFLAGTWVQMSPANVPAARTEASLVTRSNFNDVLLCCGMDNVSAAPEQLRHLDVWSWNGGDWTLLSNCDVVANPTGTGTTWPAATVGNQAIYDPLRKRVVVQGGNGIHIGANVTWVYGSSWGGSPTNYTSEFDCLTNSWVHYGNPITGATPFNNTDPAIGRISRYYGGFIAATGKVYKACGQDPTKSGSKPINNVYVYQPTPAASTSSYGAGCNSLSLTANDLPWTNRTFTVTATGFGPLSFGLLNFGIGPTGKIDPGIPLAVAPVPGPGAGCNIHASMVLLELMNPPLSATQTYSIPVPDISVDPSWVGLEVHMQAVDLDFSAGWVGTYTSNGLTAMFGAL